MGRKRLLVRGAAVVLFVSACSGSADSTSLATTTSPPSVESTASTELSVDTTAAPTTAATPATTTSAPDGAVTISVSVVAGELASERRAEVTVGDTVILLVDSDVADELHLHGYDLTIDVTPGQQAELEFVAEIPGIFEVEFESTHLQVLELVVNQ